MFPVSYEFTFDAGMRLLLLLLQHRQQHFGSTALWKMVLYASVGTTLFKICQPNTCEWLKHSIKYRYLQFLTCSTSIAQLHSCACAE